MFMQIKRSLVYSLIVVFAVSLVAVLAYALEGQNSIALNEDSEDLSSNILGGGQCGGLPMEDISSDGEEYNGGDSGSGDCQGGGGYKTPPSCDPAVVAKDCCRIVKSENQCRNYCEFRGAACGWTSAQIDSCKADVSSQCTRD